MATNTTAAFENEEEYNDDPTEWVTSLLRNTLPELDEEMQEYLIPLLSQPLEDDDEDNNNAEDSNDENRHEEWKLVIRELLQDHPDEAQQLIDQILKREASIRMNQSQQQQQQQRSPPPTPLATSTNNNTRTPTSLLKIAASSCLVADVTKNGPEDDVFGNDDNDDDDHHLNTIDSSVSKEDTCEDDAVVPKDTKPTNNNTATTKAKKTRKSQRKQQQTPPPRSQPNNANNNTTALEFWDDDASAWQERQAQGLAWGGRGYGGRGVRGDVNTPHHLHLVNVSITLPSGQELLQNATIQIHGRTRGSGGDQQQQQHHHVYGLIGRNGSGKSTLLRRLYQKAIPGMPREMSIVLVQQQVAASSTQTALQCLLEADTLRTELLQEQDELERQLAAMSIDEEDDINVDETNQENQNRAHASNDQDQHSQPQQQQQSNDTITTMTATELVQRLNDVTTQLDDMEADAAPDRARTILRGLQFTKSMMEEQPTEFLSGGWRMRLALAKALFAGAHADLWLLDEVTNHLDLAAQVWLTRYIQEEAEPTIIVVSHDRAFLNAVCTEIMVLEHAQLHYHVGNYEEYERQLSEKAVREAQILDAAERQRTKAEAFIQKHQSSSSQSVDPNKQRQAKMMKEKKLDRIGNYREDGKRYKLRSLKKLSEDHLRLAQKVEVEVDEPVIKLRFPTPTWPPGIHQPDSTLVRLDDFSFGYSSSASSKRKFLLNDITLQIQRSSKIAMVGKNGAGKSTLLKLIADEIDTTQQVVMKGELWRHASLRIGHVTQYSVEELESVAATMTVVEYADEKLRSGKASASIVQAASGNIRQYLGGFGLGGKHAHRLIGTLSGGERMRLCFATVLAEEPHLLILDESTNHIDLETLDALAAALKAFSGAVVMVSHNQGFLNGFCQGLWILGEDGRIDIRYSDEDETFDEMFTQYRNELFSGSASESRSSKRQQKASMAKRAANQAANARGHTSLI